MEVADKAVSTEDLCPESVDVPSLEATRLETLLKILVQNKVNSIKNERKCSSLYSSPKSLINRWRLTSSSTVSSKDKDNVSLEEHVRRSQRSKRRRIYSSSDDSEYKDCKKNKRRSRSNRHQKHSCSCETNCKLYKNDSDLNDAFDFVPTEENCTCEVSYSPTFHQNVWNSHNERNGDTRGKYNEDYITLKIDECEDIEEKAEVERQRLKKRRKKRRKRRKKRIQQHDRLQKIAVPINDELKDLDSEELPPRARWTIVVTACILLFMCLLLVGVTLRMAPIIDDMVRRENEELMHSLHRDISSSNSSRIQKLAPKTDPSKQT